MALVLWEPPNKHLRVLSGSRETPTVRSADDDDDNNNNVIVSDHNVSSNDTFVDMEDVALEPMDL